jgi:6-phosphogluconate dehydrogenase
MKVGIIGLGYVGLPLAVEFGKKYQTLGFDVNTSRVEELIIEAGYISGCATSIQYLVEEIHRNKTTGETPGVFMMVVPAETVEDTINELLQHCVAGDIIIDHGNSNFKDSRRRAERLSKLGIQYIDCGTSGPQCPLLSYDETSLRPYAQGQ